MAGIESAAMRIQAFEPSFMQVGILTAVRWDLENRVPTLTMEYEGARHVAVLDGDTGLLTKLYLLLGWHVGQALEKIGSLEMTPLASRLSPTR